MKKLFTIICAGLLTFSLSAQTQKGSYLIGGSSELNYTSVTLLEVDGVEPVDADANTTFKLDLNGGYFVSDGLAIGVTLSYEK